MNSFFYRLKKLIGNLFTFFFKIKSNRHKNYRCSKELLETMNSNRFSSINESSFNWSSAFLITQCVFYFLLVFINKILRYHLNHDSIKSLNSFSMYFLLILFFYSNRSAPCLIEIKNWHFPSFSYVLGLFIFHLWNLHIEAWQLILWEGISIQAVNQEIKVNFLLQTQTLEG